MGHELSIGRDARYAVAPIPAAGARVVWRERSAPRDPPAPLTPLAEAPVGPVVDVTWSPVAAADPETIVAALRAERAPARAGFDHPHSSSGCVFCRRAVAAYR